VRVRVFSPAPRTPSPELKTTRSLLILQTGDFLCFAGTNFSDWKRRVSCWDFYFYDFLEVAFKYIELITFPFFGFEPKDG